MSDGLSMNAPSSSRRPTRREFFTKTAGLASGLTAVGAIDALSLLSPAPSSAGITTGAQYPSLIEFLNAQSKSTRTFFGADFGGEEGYVLLDKSRIFRDNSQPLDYDDAALQLGRHYFQIMLHTYFMRNTSTWYNGVVPSLTLAVEFKDGPLDGKKFSYVAGTKEANGSGGPSDAGKSITVDLPFTPLIAYRGGTPWLHPWMVAVSGKNEQVKPWLSALSAIAGIFSLGWLSTAVVYGTKIMDVVNNLVAAQQSDGRAGFNRGLIKGETLKAGYHVGFERGRGVAANQLYLRGHTVYRGDKPLTEADYIVVRVRSTTETDVDFMDLPDKDGDKDGIRKLYDHATDLYHHDKPDPGETAFQEIRNQVSNSVDLSNADQDKAVAFFADRWARFKASTTA